MLHKYIPFAGLCLGFFIVIMDTTTIPLIYPTLMNVFHVGPAIVAWVNNVYLITYAAFLLLGGRLGDFTNRKYVILAAYLAIGAGAAISGMGASLLGVILGRVLMGTGAGLLTPQSMAYISLIFAKGGRGTALGIWGAVAGMAAATGPVVTQVFLTTANWRWVMWVNIPIAFLCFLIAALSLPSSTKRVFKFWDTMVSSLYGICLAGAIFGIQYISDYGLTRILGYIFLVIGVFAVALFVRNDLNKKNGYILSSELWFDAAFLRICLISGMLGAGLTAFYLPISFLLNVKMAFGPVQISVVMVTIALSNMLVGPFSGSISDRIKPKKIVGLGLTLFGLANALLGFVGVFHPSGETAFIVLCIIMIIAGTGTGLAFPPLANLALGRIHAKNIGQAMAFFSSVRQVSSAMGGVIVATVFDFVVQLQLGHNIEVTTATLRESSHITALATLACFLLIALCLAGAAYLACSGDRKSEKHADQEYKEVLKT